MLRRTPRPQVPHTSDLILVTPTYGADLALCRTLTASVEAFVEPAVHHLVLPDARDVAAFRHLDSGRIRVIPKEEFIPHGFHRLPRLNGWIHPRLQRPVGGWLMQQIVKLNAGRILNVRCVTFLDSDIAFVRPVTTQTFVQDAVRTYRLPDGIGPDMPDHLEWSAAAAEMLGVNDAPAPKADYIGPLVSWDSSRVRALLERVESVGQRRWDLQFAARRRVSEYLLYGTWIERLEPSDPPWVDSSTLCHNYWEDVPLDSAAADSFVDSFPTDCVAVLMQSISHTDPEVRARVLRRLTAGVLS